MLYLRGPSAPNMANRGDTVYVPNPLDPLMTTIVRVKPERKTARVRATRAQDRTATKKRPAARKKGQ
jgi:hypothetical protein